jgi:hypothetical protein
MNRMDVNLMLKAMSVKAAVNMLLWVLRTCCYSDRRNEMRLFTKTIERKLIANHHATNKADGEDLHHVPVVKLFDAYGSATWLLTEYDPEYEEAFGLCDLGMGSPELGYVSLTELRSLNWHGVPRIERDRGWLAERNTLTEFADRARKEQRIVSYLN